MVTLIKTLQVILALSILIFVHELGHFMWAKLFKIRVEKFYLFFDIGGKAIFKFKKGETEFGIGWLPLGGYCKISGMIDESMDLEQMKQEPKPWEFRSHKAWQRLLVMAGGVLNNFIFAIIGYSMIMGIWGSSYISNTSDSARIYASSLAKEMGFRTGDRILALDDYVPENFGMLQADIARRNVQYVTLLRGRDTLKLYIDRSMLGQVINDPGYFDLAIPFVVDSVAAGSINEGSGLLRGDRIVGIDGTMAEYMQDLSPALHELKGRQVTASIARGDDTLSIPVKVDTAGRIGVYVMRPEISHKDYGFFASIPAGFVATGETIRGYIDDLKLLAQPSTGAYKSVGSFIAIGQVFPSSWNWYQFLSILALLSIMLGVMNLLPIPGLDGGHIVFTLYEMLTGRKPGDKFMTVMQIIGMVLIFMLMILAFGNDVARLIR